MTNKATLLRVRELKKYFPMTAGLLKRQVGAVKAVDGISFDIYQGETLGLVGESGCGKSTTGRTILQLEEPTSGEIDFNGASLNILKGNALRKKRREMQMIYQDPYASLNPRMTIGQIISEPMLIHGMKTNEGYQKVSATERLKRVYELLELVGLNPAFVNRFPHEFSGGQRQRIGIARALALEPSFIICDEPIAALDVSIQAQVVNLLEDLQKQLGLTYLFIAHDLSMVRHISDRIAVMYLGKIVELTSRNALYKYPKHPYTKALLSAAPIPDPEVEETRERVILKGDVPSPANPPKGCNFCTRCPLAEEICFEADPAFQEVEAGHWVACHLYEQGIL
ncbi:MAG: ATP-binding cassette domain-containing protein [Anaerolineae bacterium]|nr:ATP-binding cassette domain-containing protein [Anaerolineae bacterium]